MGFFILFIGITLISLAIKSQVTYKITHGAWRISPAFICGLGFLILGGITILL